MSHQHSISGVPGLERLLGGIFPGDNIAWEVDTSAPSDTIVSAFISASFEEGLTLVYISFNHSHQRIIAKSLSSMSSGRLVLVDYSSKGNKSEEPFMVFETHGKTEVHGPAGLYIGDPTNPLNLEEPLIRLSADSSSPARYVFNGLAGMIELWGEEQTFDFLNRICPKLHGISAVAYWIFEKNGLTEKFLPRLRQIPEVVLELALAHGTPTLTVKKAVHRQCEDIGVPRRLTVSHDGKLTLYPESREGKELALLAKMGEALSTALDPEAFFEQTMTALSEELGMVRGTLVLLDKTTGKLRIAAALGLSEEERARGEYAVGEGVTGHVFETGKPEIIPDVARHPGFLNRTGARRPEAGPLAFICVPLKVDDEVIGVLSVDRPFADEATLEKDLRLLLIVASFVSQAIKLNRLRRLEKDELLSRDTKIFARLHERYRLVNFVGESDAIRRCLATAVTAANSKATVLITGETGTGKELMAGIVHFNSPRSSGPFVKVNCGALVDTLLESELFGHVKGAFTGAIRDRKGRFEAAHGGTLFLDEVSEMSQQLQVKLLRVLQEGEFEPVGSTRTVRVDVRVVAATSKDLREQVEKGRFREDLFYRLNVIPIRLPPLRERRDDIPLLVAHFLEKYSRENCKEVRKLSKGVLDLLVEYPWPGNIRELENCIERAVVMAPGDTITIDLLPEDIVSPKHRLWTSNGTAKVGEKELKRAIESFIEHNRDLATSRDVLTHIVEETMLRKALAIHPSFSQRELAKILGLSRVTLRKKLREYGIA